MHKIVAKLKINVKCVNNVNNVTNLQPHIVVTTLSDILTIKLLPYNKLIL